MCRYRVGSSDIGAVYCDQASGKQFSKLYSLRFHRLSVLTYAKDFQDIAVGLVAGKLVASSVEAEHELLRKWSRRRIVSHEGRLWGGKYAEPSKLLALRLWDDYIRGKIRGSQDTRS